MSKKKKDDLSAGENQPENAESKAYSGKTYFYIGIAAGALGIVFLGLIFTVLSIYSLIASIILCLAALAFFNIQKKKNNFKQVKYFTIAAYVVLSIAIAIFIGGIIYSATASGK